MSPLRFCFPTTFYPPYSFGGDAVGVQRLARALVRRGHEVTVVYNKDAYRLLTNGKEPRGVTSDDGVHVIGLESEVGWLAPVLTQQTGHPMANARRLRSILDDGRFDVINFHNTSLIGGPGIFSYGRGATKLYMAHEHWLVCPTHVLWRHNRELCDERQCLRCQLVYRRPPQWWRWTGLMRRELQHLNGFIAMSEFSRAKHHEFGFPHEMEVVPYFLADPGPGPEAAVPVFERRHARPYFLFVGRLEKIKGLDDVIPLFHDYEDADLLIAGDGNYEGHLRELAASNPRVVFLGRVPFERLRAYYQHAVATVVPSVCYETFGIILIESFRQKTPVIARRLGPFPEIVERAHGGELFGSESELVAAMRRLQGDTDYRNRLAESAYRASIDVWSESAVIPRYLEVVEGFGR
ncbi:MAG TPA: glycosyltransferase family 4 protein [Gemmatimonadaceae bacterium]|nr:glycosyltransferase family 4 protein [Gemmatimonadaceae bacterium]